MSVSLCIEEGGAVKGGAVKGSGVNRAECVAGLDIGPVDAQRLLVGDFVPTGDDWDAAAWEDGILPASFVGRLLARSVWGGGPVGSGDTAFHCAHCGEFLVTALLQRGSRLGYLGEGCVCALSLESLSALLAGSHPRQYFSAQVWQSRLRIALQLAGVAYAEALAVTRELWPLSPERRKQMTRQTVLRISQSQEQHVAQLKEAVERGEYRESSADIADSILETEGA